MSHTLLLTVACLVAFTLSCAASDSTGVPQPAAGAPTSWTAPIQLTNDASLGYGIATADAVTYVLHGNGTVKLKSIPDGGSWSLDATVATNASVSLDRPLVSDGKRLFANYVKNAARWSDSCCGREGGDFFLSMSIDKGITWTETQMTSSKRAYRSSFAIAGQNALFVWMDYRFDQWDLYGRFSTNGGTTWQPEALIVQGINVRGMNSGAQRPDVVMVNGQPRVFWMDTRDGSFFQIYDRLFTSAAAWGPITRTVPSTVYQGRPAAEIDTTGTLHLTWEQSISSTRNDNDVFYSRLLPGVTTWETPQLLSDSSGDSSHSMLHVVGPSVYLAWGCRKTGDSQYDIVARMSSSSGSEGSWTAQERLTNNPGNSVLPMIAATPGHVSMVFGDTQSGRPEVWFTQHAVSLSP